MTPAALANLAQVLKSRYPALPQELLSDALVVRLTPDQVVYTLTQLRDDPELDFKLMIDLTAVHYPDRGRGQEFDVVYQLLSVYRNHRLRIKVALAEGEIMPSVVSVWSCANWYEREVYDMFGILFRGHPDLRRLLNDYDFEGYPLRKDFPLAGRVEVRYDNDLRRVVKYPARLDREDRESYVAG